MGGDQLRMGGRERQQPHCTGLYSKSCFDFTSREIPLRNFQGYISYLHFKKSLSLFHREQIERKQKLGASGSVRRPMQGSR